MNDPKLPPSKLPSLADYLVRHDLGAMLEEARVDYENSASGGSRHLGQKDIAARFRDLRPSPTTPHEPR